MRRILTLIFVALAFAGCASRPYVIVQIADSQLGFDAVVQSERNKTEYIDDLTFEVGCLERAVAEINAMKPDMVVFTGDQVHQSWNANQWETFNAIVAKIDPSIKVVHLPGNHDVAFVEGDVDCTPFASRYGDDRFVHEGEGFKIVGFNSNLIYYGGSAEEAQKEWLDQTLSAGNPEDVCVLFCHHPFFQKGVKQEYLDMFVKNGVDVIYCGHSHHNDYEEYEGMPFITTTSVGYQLGEDKASIRVITVCDGKVTDELKEI